MPRTEPRNSVNSPIVLTVAGSDSSGGAGIQADIKAISATGSYAASVITALTAQNTLGVRGVQLVSTDFITQQFDAVYDDLAVNVVKIGMLADVPTIETVAACLTKHKVQKVVLDPKMLAASGDPLLQPEAVECLVEKLFPLATVITPNFLEAHALLGRQFGEADGVDASVKVDRPYMAELTQALNELGAKAVLVKAGQPVGGQMIDHYFSAGEGAHTFVAPHIDTQNVHGTGCSLASALASFIAQGHSTVTAIRLAKDYVNQGLLHSESLHIGQGKGPIHHFYALAMQKV